MLQAIQDTEESFSTNIRAATPNDQKQDDRGIYAKLRDGIC